MALQAVVANEYSAENERVCSFSANSIVQYFGTGMLSYFQYVKYTILVNVVLLIVTFVPGMVHSSDRWNHISLSDVWTVLTTSPALADSDTPAWFYAYIAVAILCLLLAVVFYSYYISCALRTLSDDQEMGGQPFEDPFEGLYDVDSEECVNSITDYLQAHPWVRHWVAGMSIHPNEVSRCATWAGRLISFVLFVALLVMYYEGQLYLQRVIAPWHATSPYLVRTVISLGFVVVDALWKLLCSLLTFLECHRFWSTYRRSDCIKSMSFGIAMFTIFTWVQDLVYNPLLDGCASTASECVRCKLQSRAEQMTNLIAVDVALSGLTNLLLTRITNSLCRCLFCARSSPRGDAEFKLMFNLPEEYTVLIYRQFLINQSIGLVPVAPLLGIIGAATKYWLDLFKLLRLMQFPERSNSQFLHLIRFFSFLNMLAVVFAYPGGLLFVLRKSTLGC